MDIDQHRFNGRKNEMNHPDRELTRMDTSLGRASVLRRPTDPVQEASARPTSYVLSGARRESSFVSIRVHSWFKLVLCPTRFIRVHLCPSVVKTCVGLIAAMLLTPLARAGLPAVEVMPGVWRVTIGTPEAITPVSTRHYAPASTAGLPAVSQCPVEVSGTVTDRGVEISVPLVPDELVYGLGLQLQSFEQRGKKKRLRVNADPSVDTGDSHAPVPFYVTTRGYGVFVDTARYATFYLGNKVPLPKPGMKPGEGDPQDNWNHSLPYQRSGIGRHSAVLVEVPAPARGVDVYIFAGPTLRAAVQRYNLFSGGGPVPPRWGLGFWYRVKSTYTQAEVLALAGEFRARQIPCDVLGLEPGWQSHAYSSSYKWSDRFPDPTGMLAALSKEHYRLNLWEQAFVDPSSPIYAALRPHAGDYQVWGGLVPDFLQPATREIFAAYHAKTFLSIGVSGFKADECDNSDFTGNWSFPELSRFPSGADGEQMHMLLGLRYQDALQAAFEARHQRTYGLVRSSGALAAPSPYVLYSDLYDDKQYIHAVAQSGFSGLLWTPEVRDASAGGPNELIRRLQAVVFSPLAMINAWYLQNPPWKQVVRADNNAGRFAPDWEKTEAFCRSVIALRMRFIPYLQAAFVRYHREGLPPFRAVLMDYPHDPQLSGVDDEYLMGDDLLVAPIIVPGAKGHPLPATAERSVYLPAGTWYDFWTGQRISGGRRIHVTVPLEQIPLFVKAGAILPLAEPTLSTDDPASWNLTARVYGDGARGARLFEDDGSYQPKLPEVRLEWDAAAGAGRVVRATAQTSAAPHYAVVKWERVR